MTRSILLAALLALAITACGKKEEAAPVEAAPAVEATPAAPMEAAPAAPADASSLRRRARARSTARRARARSGCGPAAASTPRRGSRTAARAGTAPARLLQCHSLGPQPR